MPAPSGADVLLALLKMRSKLPVIVITGKGDVETAVAAMKAGAVDFIQKPFDCTRLLSTISQALQTLDHGLNGVETEVATHKVATLSKRELEVLQAFEAGLTTKKTEARPSIEQALEPLEQIACTRSYCREQEISGYNDQNKYLYRVRSGVVRKSALQQGGRRHILDLLLPGDIFGFGGCRGYFAEALADRTLVSHYSRPRVEALARSDSGLAQALATISSEAIDRLERHMLILGKATALEKVSCFLLEFSSRVNGETSDVFALPISRYDIGDYLAMSSETVCRSMTELQQRGTIALQGPREVRLLDRDAFEVI
jgi:CRP/FNR family nitrogen fixation transcriptional regulator